ncbi:hypothetical protein EVAR_51630_1 [Eumeta japonica]|uniref:Uncharacterized protein n=1 Tax=Eumeta variegata TaxID=151549 RepID=A0A4C1YHE0_EUMVA|nr:hypothetical protein EVAR_51630_1 [Eumeta japonica]
MRTGCKSRADAATAEWNLTLNIVEVSLLTHLFNGDAAGAGDRRGPARSRRRKARESLRVTTSRRCEGGGGRGSTADENGKARGAAAGGGRGARGHSRALAYMQCDDTAAGAMHPSA